MNRLLFLSPSLLIAIWVIFSQQWLALLFIAVGAGAQMYMKMDFPRSWQWITISLQLAWGIAAFYTNAPILIIGMYLQIAALQIMYPSYQLEKDKQRVIASNYQQQSELLYELRKQRHDLQKHMTVLRQLDIDQAQQYKAELLSRYIGIGDTLRTESNVVAGMLYTVYEQAREKHVKLDLHIHQAIFGLPLSEYELVSLLSNMLENAIEVAADYGNGHVLFSCRKQSGLWILICQNDTRHLPDEVLDRIFTRKSRSTKGNNHEGLGTQEIARIVKQHQGTLDFSVTDHQFKLKVKIPDVKNENESETMT